MAESANTLTISGLTDYVKINRDELFVKSVAGAKTLDYVEIYPNVKYKEALNYLDSTVVLKDGSVCKWEPDGDDTFSEKYIEVQPIKVEKEFCWKDFRKKWMNYQLQWEAGRETMPVQEKITESNMNAIQAAVEDLVWKGDTGITFVGYLERIESESGKTVEFASGATVTEKIDAIVGELNLGMLKKGVRIYMSYTDFVAYIREQNSTCCANKPAIDAAVESLKYFGDSRITLIPVLGLEGTDAMVAATVDALAYGTDIEGSENEYRWFYDEKEDTFNFRVLFMAGTAIKFIDEIVLGKEA